VREACFCGRTGELKDRQPILDGEGRWVLICPECGHVDDLAWLSEEARLHLWSKAQCRQADGAARPHLPVSAAIARHKKSER
jgi:hypothetical protein